jgi:hypothetical protein
MADAVRRAVAARGPECRRRYSVRYTAAKVGLPRREDPAIREDIGPVAMYTALSLPLRTARANRPEGWPAVCRFEPREPAGARPDVDAERSPRSMSEITNMRIEYGRVQGLR